MAKTKPLTKAERAWLNELQDMLNSCPSTRIGFYTIGDSQLCLHDATREDEIDDDQSKNGGEWCSAVSRLKADFGGETLDFPNAVHSTAG
jgi:hypothetical protein